MCGNKQQNSFSFKIKINALKLVLSVKFCLARFNNYFK